MGVKKYSFSYLIYWFPWIWEENSLIWLSIRRVILWIFLNFPLFISIRFSLGQQNHLFRLILAYLT